MDRGSLADKFPKADSAIHNGGEFWGLMDNSEGLNNLCETTTCTNDKSSFEGYWE